MDGLTEHLRSLEEALLDPAVRRNRAQVEALLAADFFEFGSSGRVWTREQIFDLLATETPISVAIEDIRCALLSETVALVTYRAIRTDAQPDAGTASLRSSIWVIEYGKWRLRFHQGTRTQ